MKERRKWLKRTALAGLFFLALVTVNRPLQTSSVFAQMNPAQMDSTQLNPTVAQLVWPDLQLDEFQTGFSLPVHITHAGDGSDRLFVVEKGGVIRVIENGTTAPTPFLDLSAKVANYNECGLLSVAFAPDYAESGTFYVYYNYNVRDLGSLIAPTLEREPDLGCDSVIARFSVSDLPNVADPNSEEIVLTINQPYDNHDGGQIMFGPDGFLYIGLGDGGRGGDPHQLAQEPQSLLGKILRIAVSGQSGYAVPVDNPFVDDAGVLDEIWALGLRNPWRFSFDRDTADLWIGDVGQGSFEEIDRQPASSSGGENYGWNIREGYECFEAPPGCASENLTAPVHVYERQEGRSVTGGYVYRGGVYLRMHGVYIYADYETGKIWGLQRHAGGYQNVELLDLGLGASITSFGEDEAGELYMADISGIIYRLQDTVTRAQLTEQSYFPFFPANLAHDQSTIPAP